MVISDFGFTISNYFELSPAWFNGRKNSELKVVITFAFTFVILSDRLSG